MPLTVDELRDDFENVKRTGLTRPRFSTEEIGTLFAEIDRLRAALAAPAAVPDGWMRAIDEAMVIAHLGTADAGDDYETAKLKLNTLLVHEQSIGAYFAAPAAPSVPPGWREAVQRLVMGFEHVSGIARQWEPDHSSGADRAKWARATEACADVARMLAAAPTDGGQHG